MLGQATCGAPLRAGGGKETAMAKPREGVVSGEGVIEWRDAEGRLDRSGGPARIFPSGREEWFRHGKLHRLRGPAVLHANGSVKYYRDGVRHRVGGPACVYVNGTEKWYVDGLRHRDDGPAAIYPDGRRIWFKEGRKVREERGEPVPPRTDLKPPGSQ
jgi:hypothetical protein